MSGSGVSTVFCHAELHPETYEMSTIAWSLSKYKRAKMHVGESASTWCVLGEGALYNGRPRVRSLLIRNTSYASQWIL